MNSHVTGSQATTQRNRRRSRLARRLLGAAAAGAISMGGLALTASVAGAAPIEGYSSTAVPLYVDATGSGSECTNSAPCGTIGAAIELANAEYTYDDVTIEVGPGEFTEGDDVIDYCGDDTFADVTISGVANQTFVDADGSEYGIEVECADVTLQNLTFSGFGYDVENLGGTLNVDNCFFEYSGTGVAAYDDYAPTTTNVTNSTFLQVDEAMDLEGDVATVDSDVALYSVVGLWTVDASSVAVTNSTFTDNEAGIDNEGSDLSISTSTIDANEVGLYSDAPTSAFGTIFSENDDENCTGDTAVTDDGFNIDDDYSCGFSSLTGSIVGESPNVGALQDNGGATWTQAITPTSVAYHQIPASECPSVGERGESRPSPATSDYCDIGAYEYSPPVSISILTSPITGPTSAGANLGPAQVEALDADGLPAVSQHTITLDLSSTAPTSDFAESALGAGTAQAVIPAGSTTGEVYVGDYHPGPVPITIQGWNLITNLGTATQTETVVTGPAATVTPTAGNNQSVTVGEVYPVDLAVNVEDGTANPVDDEPVTFTVASGDATFPGDASFATVSTDVNGNSVAPTLTSGTTPGPVTIDVTTSVVGVTTSFSETELVGPAASITVTGGSDQSAQAAQPFTDSLSTQVTDQYGNDIEGDTVVYDVTSGSANFSSSSTDDQVTDGNGDTTADPLTAGDLAGNQTITATVQGTDVSTTFSDVVITPGPAANITINAGNHQSALSGTPFATSLATTVTDQYGNDIQGDTVVYDVTSGSSRFSGAATADETTGANGESSAALAAGNRAGIQTITATVQGTGVTTSFAGVTVTPPTLTYTASPFALDRSSLTSALKKEIKSIATVVNKYGETKVALVGYSSITGTTGENKALSVARAKAVEAYLKSQLSGLGDSGVSITTAGKGATSFVHGNGTLAGNRRVVATLS
jgi:outer membrane protein OmpA-like peptidoglycan-associated protein